MTTVTQTEHVTFKGASDAVSICLINLQTTYIEMLKADEIEAYQDISKTLRSYVESLAIMNNVFSDEAANDDDELADE